MFPHLFSFLRSRCNEHHPSLGIVLGLAVTFTITIVVLAGLVGRSIAPAADGRPYQRESAS